jgi:acyl carrier protein
LPQLPINSSGKVSYRQLVGARLAGAETIIPPQTLTQEKLVTIWLKFLTVAEIGIDHNFFEAGGHSLDAAQMLAQVKSQFSLDISLRQVFDNPTIRELAFLCDSLEVKALIRSTEQDNNNNIEVIEL